MCSRAARRSWVPRIAQAWWLLLACGCIETGTVRYRFSVPKNQGQLADSRTAPGRRDGYDVLGLCSRVAWTQHRIVIRGHGTRRIVRSTSDGWGDDMLELRLRAQKALGSTAQAVWYQESICPQGEYALTAFVPTYGQMDLAIERLGGVLRDEGLGDYAAVVLAKPDPQSRVTLGREWRMPLARRPYYPYEFALSAGPTYQGEWNTAFAAHVGVVGGRENDPPSKAGWFWGLGLDGRLALRTAGARWSAGPSVRLGRAFGTLAPDKPAPGTNRGTYVYGQVGAEWGSDGPVAVTSVGLTTTAVAEFALTRHNRTGNNAYLLLLPLALLNHVEVALQLDRISAPRTTAAVLLGFSL